MELKIFGFGIYSMMIMPLTISPIVERSIKLSKWRTAYSLQEHTFSMTWTVGSVESSVLYDFETLG
jgi:hypothetical protein